MKVSVFLIALLFSLSSFAHNMICASQDNVYQLHAFIYNEKYEMEGQAGINPLSCSFDKSEKIADHYLCDTYFGFIYAELLAPRELKAGSVLTLKLLDEESGLLTGQSITLECN